MFLNLYVLNRPLRKSRYTVSRTDKRGEGIKQTLSARAVDDYVSAAIALYNIQKSRGTNSYPHPRGTKLKAVLKARRQKEFVRRKAEFQDRGRGTLQDGYNQRDMIKVIRACWTNFTDAKSFSTVSVQSHLRTAVDFLVSHAMLLRGETRRNVQLADLFLLPLENEGPTPCNAMVMIIDNGKTNQFGRIEYGAVARHREPLLCTLSQLAFYLFYRWNCVREPPPCFQRRQEWYNTHVLLGLKPESPLSYEVQLSWTNRVFDATELQSLKKTHAGRSQGAQYAELAGVSENQIRRAGRWNNDALSSCYLSNLPRKFVRSIAGFPPTPAGNYYLPRAKIQPPASLRRTLWPWIDEWQTWFSLGSLKLPSTDRTPVSYEHISLAELPSEEEDRSDLAAQGFLKLLMELRTILLQDSVILQREFPDHPIWQDSIFVREDYRDFSQAVEASLLETEEPEAIRLRKLVPDLALTVSNTHRDTIRSIKYEGDRSYAYLSSISRRLDDFLTGKFTLQFHPPSEATNAPVNDVRTISTDVSASHTEATDPILTPYEADGEAQDQQRPPAALPQPPPFNPALPPPAYRMSRMIQSVHDLYQEWAYGLGSGPAVQALEEAYGARWRPMQSERVFFSRRKLILDEIRRRQGDSEDPRPATEQLEFVRTQRRMTLHGLWKWLHQQLQQGE